MKTHKISNRLLLKFLQVERGPWEAETFRKLLLVCKLWGLQSTKETRMKKVILFTSKTVSNWKDWMRKLASNKDFRRTYNRLMVGNLVYNRAKLFPLLSYWTGCFKVVFEWNCDTRLDCLSPWKPGLRTIFWLICWQRISKSKPEQYNDSLLGPRLYFCLRKERILELWMERPGCFTPL